MQTCDPGGEVHTIQQGASRFVHTIGSFQREDIVLSLLLGRMHKEADPNLDLLEGISKLKGYR